MTDELCDQVNEAHIVQQRVEKVDLLDQLGRREDSSASQKLEHDQLQAVGQMLRARLADPEWILFNRHQWGSELHAAYIDQDHCLVVEFIERRRFEPPRNANYTECEFIGDDLVVRKEWDGDKPKE